MKKIILLIFIIIALLSFSFNTKAFMNGKCGDNLDLYKNIKEGSEDFHKKQIPYEMSGQKRGEMAKNINNILEKYQIGACLKEGVNDKFIGKIIDGGVEELANNMKEECYDSENKAYSMDKLSRMMGEIENIRDHYKEKVDNKCRNMEQISRIGMFVDGNTQNSPFDIIADIQEINQVLFKDEIPYEADEDSESINEYLKDPFAFNEKKQFNNNSIKNNSFDTNDTKDSQEKDKKDIGNSVDSKGFKDTTDKSKDKKEVTQTIITQKDGNSYLCPQDQDESGLSEDSLKKIIETENIGGGSFTFDYGKGGHKKLSKTNKFRYPGLSDPNFLEKLREIDGVDPKKTYRSPYSGVNDNKMWKCNKYFCIIINIVISKFNPISFDEGNPPSKSMENILETAGKNLKRGVNTSLVQNKMTTNNFEMPTRDLNLPDIFHMGAHVSCQAVPQYDLQKDKSDKEKKEDNKKYVKNLLNERCKNFNLEYEKINDLGKFSHMEEEQKSMIKTAGLPYTHACGLSNEFSSIAKINSQINNYTNMTNAKKLRTGNLNSCDKRFREVEQFTDQTYEFLKSMRLTTKEMKKIPAYSG